MSQPPDPPPRPAAPPSYPLLLDLRGSRVVVVGGGGVAARRVPALVDAGAAVVVVSPSLHPTLAALHDEGRLRWLPRRYADGDLAGAWLVHACTDDPAVNAAVGAAAAQHQTFCVRADDRHAATAWVPAVARRGDVVVAVNAGGAPARARALRDQVADALFGAAPPSEPPGPPERPEPQVTGGPDPAGATVPEGSVALVGAGPGDPGLLTVRGRELLARADVVLVDRLVDRAVLAAVPATAEVIDVGKRGFAAAAGPADAQARQQAIEELLVASARAGRRVVRLKGGDPFVFGRGGEEALACVRAGIAVEVVPGITSAIAVPAYAGIPVTMRGSAQELWVVTGHLDPDDPDSLVRWRSYADHRGTLVVLMGLAGLAAVCAALIRAGRAPDTPAACIARGTTSRQRVVVGDLATLPAAVERANLPAPAITVVGDVVRLREKLAWFPGGAATAQM